MKRHNFWTLQATLYPFGLAAKAPGTWGSFASIPILLALKKALLLSSDFASLPWLSLAITAAVLIAAWSWLVIDRTEKYWHTHDDARIVIDEFAGMAIPLLCLSGGWLLWLSAFTLFRFFDIVKPGPIGWADRHLPGAAGTLVDDLLAGLATFLCLLPFF